MSNVDSRHGLENIHAAVAVISLHHGQRGQLWVLGLWVQHEGPDGGTGPCCRDPSNRPSCACHHSSPSIALAAVRGCKLLETSRRNSKSCVDAVAMVDQSRRSKKYGLSVRG
ncbi:hypothetical protein MUK42_27213 [Musa troglodytarum]|uniref:Uncharacterized protein n=1 Tax=Musa troglodytarum TaxID=320322 RepID=A0A9E7JPZ1_9LILI|nr:hypothetical protein MUK42_27213 [Musa troglodytarum]